MGIVQCSGYSAVQWVQRRAVGTVQCSAADRVICSLGAAVTVWGSNWLSKGQSSAGWGSHVATELICSDCGSI